jgi:tyrosinase
MAAETPETLASTAGKPVALGTGPVTVPLVPPASAPQVLSARVASVSQDRKVYLVVKGFGADEPPGTIYQVYLGLPRDVAPSPDGIYYVGTLNFFNAMRGGASVMARSDQRFLSFDVTDLLKTLQSRHSLGDDTTVTIVPANKPSSAAKPMVGNIALVAQ